MTTPHAHLHAVALPLPRHRAEQQRVGETSRALHRAELVEEVIVERRGQRDSHIIALVQPTSTSTSAVAAAR